MNVPFDQIPHACSVGSHTTWPMPHDWVDGFHTTGALAANGGGGGAGGAPGGAAADVAGETLVLVVWLDDVG